MPDPLIRTAQQALTAVDPGLLPRFGADGFFGKETSDAIVTIAARYQSKIDALITAANTINELTANVNRLEQQLTQSEADQDLAAAVRALIAAEAAG